LGHGIKQKRKMRKEEYQRVKRNAGQLVSGGVGKRRKGRTGKRRGGRGPEIVVSGAMWSGGGHKTHIEKIKKEKKLEKGRKKPIDSQVTLWDIHLDEKKKSKLKRRTITGSGAGDGCRRSAVVKPGGGPQN